MYKIIEKMENPQNYNENVRNSLNLKKLSLMKEFSDSIEHIKRLFEGKLIDFIEEILRYSFSYTLLAKNQETYSQITTNLNKILDNFESIEKNLKKPLISIDKAKINLSPIEKTIKAEDLHPNIYNKPSETTIINSPLLLNIKETDNLADLQRKPLISSFQRPKSTSVAKNLRNETFAKIYLAELYYKSKEIIKKQKN